MNGNSLATDDLKIWKIKNSSEYAIIAFNSETKAIYQENIIIRYEVVDGVCFVQINGGEIHNTGGKSNSLWPIYLHNVYITGPLINSASASSIKYCKFNNYTLVPCVVTQSGFYNDLNQPITIGTKGYYNSVTGKIHTNRGTGEDFIAGPDV